MNSGVLPSIIKFFACLLFSRHCDESVIEPSETLQFNDGRATIYCPGYFFEDAISKGGFLTNEIPSSTTDVALVNAHQKHVCTITRHSRSTPKSLAPVARSYKTKNWDRVAGEYASALNFSCGEIMVNGTLVEYCNTTLPALSSSDQYFNITSFRNNRSRQEKYSSFLQMTTFGANKQTIEDLAIANEGYAAFVFDQVYNTSPTLHRAYFRDRADARAWTTNHMSLVSHPCAANSRWRQAAFTLKDRAQEIRFVQNTTTNLWKLYQNGYLRTVLANVDMASNSYTIANDNSYEICSRLIDQRSGRLDIRMTDGRCQAMDNFPLVTRETLLQSDQVTTLTLPAISDFKVLEDGILGMGTELVLEDGIAEADCPVDLPSDFRAPVFGVTPSGEVLIHDTHALLETNNLTDVLTDGGGSAQEDSLGITLCSNVPRNLFNDADCEYSEVSNVCDETTNYYFDAEITLSHETLQKIYNVTGRFVYAIDGLVTSGSDVDPPCTSGTISRWRKTSETACAVETAIDSTSKMTLSDLIRAASSTATFSLVDITVSSAGAAMCPDASLDISITVDSSCWEHVHPDLFGVYDLTAWAELGAHPGNQVAARAVPPRRNPIKKWAEDGLSTLVFPGNHPMLRWDDNKSRFPKLGSYLNQVVQFNDLPSSIRLDPSVLAAFGVTPVSSTGDGFRTVVCGSPGEVANTPHSMAESFDLASYLGDTRSNSEFRQQRATVWTMIALNSKDQLRQRTAWALAQLLAISPDAIGGTNQLTEMLLGYYDIFVRHAFGNYRDVLREVSYSPMMGEMLSYRNSRSSMSVYESTGNFAFADENYAREVMQLFSIGLVTLNLDGTAQLDAAGNPIRTYTNDDITSYARAWTGFIRDSKRGNIEEASASINRIDPMVIRPDYRDRFPKTDLSGGYVGDKYPLCVDLPQHAFLKQGATYRMLGSNPEPYLISDTWTDAPEDDDHLTLHTSSPLYAKLCNNVTGVCQWQATVTLDRDLDCALSHDECRVDTLRVVRVVDNFFEYVQRPCVELAYYDSAQTIKPRRRGRGSMCGNPLLPVASDACCNSVAENSADRFMCNYVGERMTYGRASDRCENLGLTTCSYRRLSPNCGNCCKWNEGYHWHNQPCTIQAKVRPSDGTVAIVHASGDATNDAPDYLSTESLNFFRVHWAASGYPDASCGSCGVLANGECLCDMTISETALFTSLPNSAEEILNALHIGAVAIPDTTNSGRSWNRRGFSAYSTSGLCCDQDTVFKVFESYSQRTFLLKNVVSMVQITGSTMSFRNPPHFNSLIRSNFNRRDAQYETEAVIDTYFYHQNTAPFIATRLMQRFGFSNPSPTFVESVAEAFQSGAKRSKGLTFGSGRYGDIAATVAAIVLHPEATAPCLDSDPSHGSLREPLLKVIAVMRALEFTPFATTPLVEFSNLETVIGMMAHAIPTVFSFFLPEHSPPGVVSAAGLVAPEAQIMTSPRIMGLMNGLFSLIKVGLTHCDTGFGSRAAGAVNCNRATEGNFGSSSGQLMYNPPTDRQGMVRELNMLLTGGRLSDESEQAILSAVTTGAPLDDAKAARLAQQLVISTPEFHGSGVMIRTGENRPEPQENPTPVNPYKAVIQIMLRGGVDSFNLLVPYSGCTGMDMYDHYADVRQNVAMAKSRLRTIQANTSQVCETFGIHENFRELRSLYNAGDALFVSNVGVMTKPVTKDNYREETRTDLFAHNAMQAEIKRLDPYNSARQTGFLGRLSDALKSSGYKTRAVAIDASTEALVGKVDVAEIFTVDQDGATPFNEEESVSGMTDLIKELNGDAVETSNLYGETWSSNLIEAIYKTDVVNDVLSTNDVTVNFPNTGIGNDLALVARLIKARTDMKVERDFFYIEMGGFDTHSDVEERLDLLFSELNVAVRAFVDEMTVQNVWEDVTVVQTSDFGRTLTPNSGEGTDHAWAGNVWMLGGNLNGGRILGTYPDRLDSTGDLNVGRGRLIPTTSYDQFLGGVAEWAGATNAQLDDILPNRGSFDSTAFSMTQLYNVAW